jgi:hypothetical protein
MARLTRKDLKNLLKECLLEILREEKILAPLKENLVTNNNKHVLNENPYNNQQKSNVLPINNKNSALIETVQTVANAFGSKSSMFADLLADTAMTTLQAQRNGGLPGDRLGEGMILESFVEAEQKNDVQSLQNLAPDGDVKKWAKFAFAKKE